MNIRLLRRVRKAANEFVWIQYTNKYQVRDRKESMGEMREREEELGRKSLQNCGEIKEYNESSIWSCERNNPVSAV
jgi:hypothetical protein